MPKTPKIYLGLDPGKQGGIAFIDEDGEIVGYKAMPETELDVSLVLSSCTIHVAVIEQVSSSPQMGVSSSFTFGRGYGFLRGVLIANAISFGEVRPQVWMKTLGIRTRKKGKKVKGKKVGGETDAQWKNYLRGIAQQRFPSLEVWKRTKGEQLAVCDALLIAEYCRIVHRGE